MPEATDANNSCNNHDEPDVIVERQSALFHHASSMSDDKDANNANDANKLETYYVVGKQIGVGHGVRICRHKRTGQKRALKTMPKQTVSKERFHQEIAALRKVDHPNTLRLFESFEDDHYYYIITELSTAGNLYEYLVQNFQHLTEPLMAKLMKQILICVNHCHAMNIIHCDIKPENILMEKGDDVAFERLVLADFGFAMFYDENIRMNQIRGTPSFCSPEILRGIYEPRGDIWACGVLAFVLLTGQFPFGGTTPKEIYQQQIKQQGGDRHFNLEIWDHRTQEAKLFCQHLLTIDETERPTAQEALRHPWFDLMHQLEEETTQSTSSSSSSPQTLPALEKLVEFSAKQKLKQATYAYLVAHLTLKSRKKVIDQIFRQVDSNSDGLLSQEEIEQAFREEKGQLLTAAELLDIFDRVDIDHNGSINYWEFLAATTRSDTILCNENLKIAFEAFDKNQSGTIGASEVKSLFTNQQQFRPQQQQQADGTTCSSGTTSEASIDIDESIIDAIIQQVDENGDGEISYEEFAKMMQENLISSSHKRTSDRSSSAESQSESDLYNEHQPASQRQRSC